MTMASQQFDTGLPLPQRSMIRQAIVNHLGTTPTGTGRPLLRSAGGYVNKIGQLPRLLDGSDEDIAGDLWVALQGVAPPALCVALGDEDFESVGIGGRSWTSELEVAVYAVSSNLRALVDGRLSPDVVAAVDPTADPGIETMVEHVRQLLCGEDFSLPTVHAVKPKAVRHKATGADVTIWEHRFTVGVDVDVNPQRANSEVAGDLEVRSVLTP
jgi:hypothetical protein